MREPLVKAALALLLVAAAPAIGQNYGGCVDFRGQAVLSVPQAINDVAQANYCR